MGSQVLGVVGSATGGVEQLLPGLIRPALAAGWTVAVTLTPTAGRWLSAIGAVAEIEEATDLPVRWESRLPTEPRPHPPVDCYAVAPASANTVAKLALGIADNQALTQVCEALGTKDLPVVIFPRVNAAHARHPAWESHLDGLRRVGAHLVYGEDVWPRYEPRVEPAGQQLPWAAVLAAANAAFRP